MRTLGRIASLALLLGGMTAGCRLFGGGDSDPIEDLRLYVRSEVMEPDRARRMLSEIDEIDQAVDRWEKNSKSFSKELQGLNRRPSASKDELTALYTRINQARRKTRGEAGNEQQSISGG